MSQLKTEEGTRREFCRGCREVERVHCSVFFSFFLSTRCQEELRNIRVFDAWSVKGGGLTEAVAFPSDAAAWRRI